MMLPPNSVIGIVGGGQLGRMIGVAASRLGYRVHVFTDRADSSAAQITNRVTVAAYDDLEAMRRFADAVDVVTIEFENLPVEGLHAISGDVPVHPSPDVLAICQDRLAEKRFLQNLDVPTAAFAGVSSAKDLESALAGVPAILKTRRMGYDGKGQVKLDADADPVAVWDELDGREAVLEGFVQFERELSVITARNAAGDMASYVPVENRHEHHILAKTIAPAPISDDQARAAQALAERIAEGLDLVGLLAVEMFQTRDGKILVNELAPRPHNSGHWTLDACLVSQFEQTVRAITGLPLGSPVRFADAEMDNLLGDAAEDWPELIRRPNARLHLYGKTPIRPGRKHGHVTTLRLPPLSR
ncbi:MAG: 5-(carboxyamino)imidazole ribonucleotide synthase [Alphaproteobacteria bacterium]|nr:5-(carboxyamino)imidazole ribonucleotide synthase [Alphaproteobacteria bacterium]